MEMNFAAFWKNQTTLSKIFYLICIGNIFTCIPALLVPSLDGILIVYVLLASPVMVICLVVWAVQAILEKSTKKGGEN